MPGSGGSDSGGSSSGGSGGRLCGDDRGRCPGKRQSSRSLPLEKPKRARDSTASVPAVIDTADFGDCPICLDAIDRASAAQPNACQHVFCADCLAGWYRAGHNTCPVDRSPFDTVLRLPSGPGSSIVRLPIQRQQQQQRRQQQEQLDDATEAAFTLCAFCGMGLSPEPGLEEMAECNHCGLAYHLDCMPPEWPQEALDGPWLCEDCARHLNE